ncbi:MAG TPA: OmpA family protein, partial [Candidatus Obscuribacterales bacterium]
KTVKVPCSERFLIGADTLFEFDKATLNPKAEETLNVLAPMIQRLGPHPIVVEGHTDAIGTDDYNQQLSERRAERVKNWLLQNHVAEPKALRIVGYGEQRPIAPNTKPDGSDNPVGRAQNRRVVIIVNTCKSIDDVASASASTASGADEKADAALKGSDRPADVSASGTSSGAPEREAAE